MTKKANRILLFLLIALTITFTLVGGIFSIKKVSASSIIYANYSTGNDTTGDGSSGNPYKTFHKAYTIAVTGDTIDLTGTFDWSDDAGGETGDAITTGYTLNKNLTIQGHGATATIIQADDTPYTANRRIFTLNSGKTVTLQDLTIRHGYTASSAHAIDASYANLIMLRTVTTLNRSSLTYQDGGTAILHNGDSNYFIMRNSTVSENGNMSGYNNYTGGITIYSLNNTNEITNSTFFHNSGAYNGAIYLRGYLTVTNSTFVANRGTVSGTDIHSFGTGSIAYVKNSIFADSAGVASLVAQSSGVITDGGYNIVETQSGTNFVNGVNGNLVGNQASLNIAASLEDNNSLYDTPTLALSAGSVAINAGDSLDGAHHGISVPTEDQRGAARPDRTDIGAYEYGGLIDIPEPTTQASEINFSSVTSGQATINWTNGNGGRRAVFVKAASSGSSAPEDGQVYTADTIFGLGEQLGETAWYCVYNGTGNSVTVTNLMSETTYIAHVAEYNGTLAGTQNYLTSSATNNPNTQLTNSVITPTVQSSAVTVSAIGSTSATISFTPGNGEKRVVFIKSGLTSDLASVVDRESYTANSIFGSGEQIGNSGWYSVYTDSGSSVSVTGLISATTYIIQVVEYNGSTNDERYLKTIASGNPKIFKTAAEASIGSGTSVTTSTGAAPINKYYYSLHGQSVYTVAEINAAGITGPITINQIGFDVVSAPTSSLTNFVVRMKHTASADVSSWQTVTDMVTVYSNANYTPVAGGFHMLTLSTPFNWNGTSNIVVDTAFSVSSGSGGTVKYTTLSNGYRHTRSDSTDQTNVFSGGSAISTKPNIKLSSTQTTPYTVVYSTGGNGSISGDEIQAVASGQNGSAVTANANSGYEFDNWSDDSTDNPRTEVAVSDDKYLNANFSIVNYSLRYSASPPGPGSSTAYGSISGSANQSVEHGSSGSAVTAVPNTGYHFVRWSDGSTQNPRIDTNVSGSINVYAIFEADPLSLRYTAGNNGIISGFSSQTVSYGTSGSAVVAVANNGYSFSAWSDGKVENPRIDANVTSNISVIAYFTLIKLSSGGNSNLANPIAKEIEDVASSNISPATNQEAPLKETFFTKAYESEGKIYLSEIRFKIIEDNGNPISGLLVTLHSEPKQTTTDQFGFAIFKDVESGDHSLAFDYKGKSIAKKVAVSQPTVTNEVVELKPIEIKVEDETPSRWPYILLGAGLVIFGLVISKFLRKRK